jgi:CheY-like chemotaxis protein
LPTSARFGLFVVTMAKKILIADDNVDCADSTGMLLGYSGQFEVRVVYGGLEAVEAARTFVPDLVLLDINMPGMDGYQAASMIRSECPQGRRLILVAFTGRASSGDVELALRSGFDHHFSKSAADPLCASIASLLE